MSKTHLYYRTHNKFCRGLPELKNAIFLSTLSVFCCCRPVAGEELQLAVQLVQLAVQLVLFRQLAIALQLFYTLSGCCTIWNYLISRQTLARFKFPARHGTSARAVHSVFKSHVCFGNMEHVVLRQSQWRLVGCLSQIV